MLQLEIGKCRNLTFEQSAAVLVFSFYVYLFCFIHYFTVRFKQT